MQRLSLGKEEERRSMGENDENAEKQTEREQNNKGAQRRDLALEE